MRRSIGVFRLVVAAVLAAGVLLSPGAAANPVIVPAEKNVTVTAEQVGQHEFHIGSQALRCNLKATGSLAEASQTLTLTSEYKECSTKPVLGISLPGTVNMNGCDHLFHGETPGGEAEGSSAFNVDLVCPAGKVVEVSIFTNAGHTELLCTLTLSPQSGLKTTTATNTSHEGKANDVKTEHNVSVQVQRHGSELCGPAESTAKYTGTTTLRATDGESQETGLAVLKTPKVVLCKANEVPCQNANIFEEKLVAKAQTPEIDIVYPLIGPSPVVCESSEWESLTAKEGHPRLKGLVPGLGLNFNKCEEVSGKKSCSVNVLNLPWNLAIGYVVGQDGRMALTESFKGDAPILAVICGSGFNCLFKASEEDEGLPAIHMDLWGDNSTPTLRASGIELKKLSCTNTLVEPLHIVLASIYTVSQPTPLWVSYVQ